MITMFLTIAIATTPLLAVIGLLKLTDWREVRRAARVARQIELTDAIHRELGAVAAPTVKRRAAGGWLVRISVPLDRPALVAAILRVTEAVFTARGSRTGLRIVLAPSAALSGRSPVARRRAAGSSVAAIASSH